MRGAENWQSWPESVDFESREEYNLNVCEKKGGTGGMSSGSKKGKVGFWIFYITFLTLGVAIFIGGFLHQIFSNVDRNKIEGSYGQLVEINEKKMNVSVSGSGDQVVVFLPQTAETSPYFAYLPLTDEMAEDYTTVVIEPFGYGLSEDTEEERTVENLSDEIHRMLQALGYDEYILASDSGSGLYALYYMNQYPEEVEAFVGFNSMVAKQKFYVNHTENRLQQLIQFENSINSIGVLRMFSSLSEHFILPENAEKMFTEEERNLYRKICISRYYSTAMYNEVQETTKNMNKVKELSVPKTIPCLFLLSQDTQNQIEEIGGTRNTWEELHLETTENKRSRAVLLDGGNDVVFNHYEEIPDMLEEWLETAR